MMVSTDHNALVLTASDLEVDNALSRLRATGVDIRVLRGEKMLDPQSAYDEIAAAFQFPLYFGHNLMGVDDLLTDLGWLDSDHGWAAVIAHAERFLSEDLHREQDLPAFARMFMRAKEYWAGSVRYDESTAPPQLPFNLVLVGSETDPAMTEAWSKAAIDFTEVRL